MASALPGIMMHSDSDLINASESSLITPSLSRITSFVIMQYAGRRYLPLAGTMNAVGPAEPDGYYELLHRQPLPVRLRRTCPQPVSGWPVSPDPGCTDPDQTTDSLRQTVC